MLFTGDLVEKGVMRRLPEGFDGNKSPYVFTWSNERPNKVRNDFMFLGLGSLAHGPAYGEAILLSSHPLEFNRFCSEGLGHGVRLLTILQHGQGGRCQHPHGSLLRRG